jgi:D-glycero-alpha-D-manno-heptose 1-phosphate guanylyltransferase
MIHEAIVLAGGFGTRLKEIVKEVPKPMAIINDKPFLYYLFKFLKQNGIQKIILSVGYKAEVIEEYFGEKFDGMNIEYSHEDIPLGTGGGLKKATSHITSEYFFAMNGDTFFDVNLQDLGNFTKKHNHCNIALALKLMTNFDRYGTVSMNNLNTVVSFEEKKQVESGLINGGIYCLKKQVFSNITDEKFSFEKDVLEKMIGQNSILGMPSDTYFIDIGIPEDYYKAQHDFKKMEY